MRKESLKCKAVLTQSSYLQNISTDPHCNIELLTRLLRLVIFYWTWF